ncbi:hypothetical protein [Proteus penneri]|uniref:hypothetical protein n=1 Tax=Proteus penneri TaxID=102862 RepID=UPI00288B5C6E|nr:hypothetical protein [Proteus penneri]
MIDKLIANLIPILTLVIAFLAYNLAKSQLASMKKESLRGIAYSVYKDYLRLCFENPDFSYGNKDKIVINGKLNEKYPWYISQMLFTFEQILEVDKKDNYWNKSIYSQLKRHDWYLKDSNSIKRCEWTPTLQKIIDIVIKEHK